MIDMPCDIMKEAYQNALAYEKQLRAEYQELHAKWRVACEESQANLDRAITAEQQRLRTVGDAHTARLSIERKTGLLREWIREEGERTNTCTFHILGDEICRTCRCERSRDDYEKTMEGLGHG